MSEPEDLEVALAGRVGEFRLDVAFRAPMRGVTALFGASGSGKTTVLRAIAGLARLGGRVRVGDAVWQDDAAGVFRRTHRRALGYVFQEPSLFPHLSVRGNLAYGLKRSGSQPSDLDATAELLGLGSMLERSPANLSGGERQRVAIGRALLSRPSLLLMDEPLAALDRASKAEILPYLERLHRERAIPVLYVSHDVSEVARLANDVVVLSAGKVAARGGVEVFEQVSPSGDRAEAGAVVTARVVGEDRDFRMTRLDLAGQVLSIPFAGLTPGQEIRLRIRARDVSVATRRPEAISVRNVLEAVIVSIEEEPDTPFADLHLEAGSARLRAQVTREAVAALALRPGQPVYALLKSVSFASDTFG
ncbi:molybdenum ABC transporter ATP-binding protein [Amorphus orientalis]|uniref:Molybdate transport system ATP-binding protein n=1 Tax=Amorphus orientalis TaxID=649198 RepID=A0AAE3VKE2_9HYPH|nr:molybdenum ABC transporter ATP-binding protein [Amorphus orientalis]MDQ0313681.1 molybdate transport system ATP-binding protein [Amorphus orientalis]